jgi:citrate lyase subunit beta / citryl-CoA lyase
MLPKCAGQNDLEQLSFYLDALEAREALAAGSTRILAISTETAAATLNLGSTRSAAPSRLWGTMWGSEDLAASLGASANRDDDGRYTFPYQSARSQCLYAASALGITAIDAVWTDFRDFEGLERETSEGLRDGFSAKAAIHPAQVEVINRVLTPRPEQLEWANAVVDLLQKTGVARLDGKMVDLAHKRIAERLLKRAAAISV